MEIKDIFVRPIDRSLEGVIKADALDDATVKQELDEYVVTDELKKHFAKFFHAYADSIGKDTEKMGVWISGFFGSGKSHFLKILSYLLENREIDGRHAVDFFDADRKISDPMVIADIHRSESIPTDVILFNIDAKSSKQQGEDSLLDVFIRVFNEMRGYCGALPYVAELERKLDEKGRYQEFKDRYIESTGSAWVDDRDDFDFLHDDVVDVLTSMKFMSEEAARNWCEKADQRGNRMSIEDFAERVKKYLDSRGRDSRMVFLIDEVGQYVSQDPDRMLNLQTITEQLGTKCKGRAWIVVTSQQAVDTITKMDKFFRQDFSKIQGRFDTRISLSSADADTVIKKRILEKTEAGTDALTAFYEGWENEIQNLFHFTGEVEHKLYKNKEDYAAVFPFVPYQFSLLGQTLTEVRKSGASGKHLSSGERSLLSLFKESAQNHMHEGLKLLMPYYAFYGPLEDFLDHNNRSVISNALKNEKINPDHEEDCFTVNVLKVLFMIKNLDTLEPNLENITTLMIDNVSCDRIKMKEEVEKSLKILCGQMLVQKNGDRYTFLSDEEQTINRTIGDIEVEAGDVYKEMNSILFDTIYKEKKYHPAYLSGRYFFPLGQYIDDEAYGRTGQGEDMAIHIITGSYSGRDNDTIMAMKSAEAHQLLIVLPEDMEYFTEIRTALQITKFLNQGTKSDEAGYRSILEAKRVERREREERAAQELKEALTNARFYVNGERRDIKARDPVARINEGLEKLCTVTYCNLNYIDTGMDESDIRNEIRGGITGNTPMIDSEPNALAQAEVLDFIRRNTMGHMPISRKKVEDQFVKAPYGFNEMDIRWILARLFHKGDITFNVSGETITFRNRREGEIFDYIMKKSWLDKLLMEERVKVPDTCRQAAQNIMAELFKNSNASRDEDAFMDDFFRRTDNMIGDMKRIQEMQKNSSYPGKDVIRRGLSLLEDMKGKTSPLSFYQALYDREEDFEDLAEDYEDVEKFFADGSKQREIFDNALLCLRQFEKSRTYIDDPAVAKLAEDMKKIMAMPVPYGRIHELVELREKFMEVFSDLMDAAFVKVQVDMHYSRMAAMDELKGKPYEIEVQKDWGKQFSILEQQAESCAHPSKPIADSNLAVLYGFKNQAYALRLRLVGTIPELDRKWEEEHEPVNPQPAEHGDNPSEVAPPKPAPVVREPVDVPLRHVFTDYSWKIHSEEDIDGYLKKLKAQLEKELKEKKSIIIHF